MDCSTCKQELLPLMGSIPESWREKISEALCNATPRSSATTPETLTSLSEWSIEDINEEVLARFRQPEATEPVDKILCITYKDENLKEWKRCIDLKEFFNRYWDGIAPKLVATQEVWDSLDHLGRFQAIISRICNTCTPVPFIYYYGWKDTKDTLSPVNIEAGTSGETMSEQDITVDYTGNTEPKYLWMAEPITEPIKTGWRATDINRGGIGGLGLFAQPVVSGNYRFYITQYKTQNTENTITFLW